MPRKTHQTKTGSEEIVIEGVDQYTIQSEQFARSILEDSPVPNDLMNAVNNMKVIDVLFRSARQDRWNYRLNLCNLIETA